MTQEPNQTDTPDERATNHDASLEKGNACQGGAVVSGSWSHTLPNGLNVQFTIGRILPKKAGVK